MNPMNMFNHANEDNITHKAWREDNPVNNPFAIDVISLPYNNLSVKGENKLETTAWRIKYIRLKEFDDDKYR